jgi:hypothetical protein
MFHNSKAAVALSHEPNPTIFQKTISINDWYFGDADYDYPMGNIQMTGKTRGAIMKGYAPLETFLMPNWGDGRDRRPCAGFPDHRRTGPARPRQPGHDAAADGSHQSCVHGEQPGLPPIGCGAACRVCWIKLVPQSSTWWSARYTSRTRWELRRLAPKPQNPN